VVDLPLDLDALDVEDRRMIEQFLKWAKERRAHESYIARHRRAWWAVGLREPPPILCTYMARRPPSFALNLVGAHHLNVAHGLYPLEPMSEVQLRAVLNYLQKTVSVRDGRTYAGGLVKFEPGEVERLRIPEITRLAERPIA
jgi:hypothetical protein